MAFYEKPDADWRLLYCKCLDSCKCGMQPRWWFSNGRYTAECCESISSESALDVLVTWNQRRRIERYDTRRM